MFVYKDPPDTNSATKQQPRKREWSSDGTENGATVKKSMPSESSASDVNQSKPPSAELPSVHDLVSEQQQGTSHQRSLRVDSGSSVRFYSGEFLSSGEAMVIQHGNNELNE